ncbi:hypothetical protein [Vreelandella olivaria]|uniref:hypothetical protein n=1 Tax=Vreelandella olivaria TaxID=390919 RepID=UPI00201EA634|nr:hypothetical protein [Halomonas olivaria]
MRLWPIMLAAAIVLAGGLAAQASSEPFESRLVRLEAQRALPALETSLREESAELNAIFLHYAADQALWMSAHLAILRYGDMARSVLREHADSAAFQRVLVRFGADAVLPVSYFRDHDIATLRAQHWIGERYQQLSRWWGDEEAPPLMEWSPYRRGQMGIVLLETEGHALLNQFVTDSEGSVKWLQSERVVSGVGDFFTSGIRSLESQWRSGDEIGASDMGWAGVDLLVMASAVKVLRAGRVAQGSRVGLVEAQGARAGIRQGVLISGGRFAHLSRIAKVGAVATTAFVVVRHPSLISALGANVAKWLGWPAWLGQFVIWLVVLLPVLFIMRFSYRWVVAPLRWCVVPLLRFCIVILSRLSKRRSGAH